MTEEEIVITVREIVSAVLGEGYMVRLIGSRSNGTARTQSDFDFLISGPHPVPILKFVELQHRVEELPTLHTIDFADEHRVSEEFLATIQ